MSPRSSSWKSRYAVGGLALFLTFGSVTADTVITDFNSAPIGSADPRAGWFAFGVGLLDAGVHAGGSAGLSRDGDFNLDGAVDLLDYDLFSRCFTGSGLIGPVAGECQR